MCAQPPEGREAGIPPEALAYTHHRCCNTVAFSLRVQSATEAGREMTKQDAAEAILAAKHALGASWCELAELAAKPEVWSTAALLGQHPIDRAAARRIAERLELGAAVVEAMTRQP